MSLKYKELLKAHKLQLENSPDQYFGDVEKLAEKAKNKQRKKYECFVKCSACGKISYDTDFVEYIRQDPISLGTCRKCHEQKIKYEENTSGILDYLKQNKIE